jgi:hypothetical protein
LLHPLREWILRTHEVSAIKEKSLPVHRSSAALGFDVEASPCTMIPAGFDAA